MKSPVALVLMIGLLLYVSCDSDGTVEPLETGPVYSMQFGGCVSGGVAKSVEAVAPSYDCSFEYFAESLVVDVQVTANCCPEHNRFTISSRRSMDSLCVAIVDTAEQLCDCICPYDVRTVVREEELDTVRLWCTYNGALAVDSVLCRN